MNVAKIDFRLFKEIEVLSASKKVFCFVFSKNYYNTKHILCELGIHIVDEYLFIKTFFCEMTQQQIFKVSNIATVDYICSVSNAASQMYIAKKILHSDNLRETGKGIGVAFIDTGISPHADFLLGENRIRIFKDFISQKNNCYDDNGHGTFVAGVCSGNGALSNFKYAGIAPKTDIYALKALNENGEATANKILDAMEWIFENHKNNNIKVVCMSFGSEPLGSNDPIMLGAEELWKEGFVVVAAAGNSGPEYQTIKSPGVSKKIITVGGIADNRCDDCSYDETSFEVANFSSRGPAFKTFKPDLVAPSVDIKSCGTKSFYTNLSGTSVATPMVAGLACLVLERYPQLGPEEVKNVILKSCKSLGFEKNIEGFGLPNLAQFMF